MASTDICSNEFERSQLVLLVDDQPIVGEALRQVLLEVDDLSLHYCQEPAMVMELVAELRPSVILLDILMPDIDGITLLRYLRQNPATASIPVVMLSSKEEGSEKAAAFEAGANDYLVKIPEDTEMVARLRYHAKFFSNLVQRDEAYRALKISQEKLAQSNLELQRAVARDGLTGIFNRRHFDEQSRIEWARSQREQQPMTLMMVDIDKFKPCNDIYGHAYGDDCLRKVAQCIADQINRPTDFVARYGGEEFVVLLPNTDEEGAMQMAEKIRRAVESLEVENNGSDIAEHVTVSVGVHSLVPQRDSNLEQALSTADRALYQAKKSGRNRVECC